MALTNERVASLAQAYSYEQLVAATREKRIEWIPVLVGNGLFDLDPATTPPCTFCGEHLVDYVEDDGSITALGLGVWTRGNGWKVAHGKCVRQIADGVEVTVIAFNAALREPAKKSSAATCPCTCHDNLIVHDRYAGESVCCDEYNEERPDGR